MSDENEDGLDMWAEAMDEQAAAESEEANAQAVELDELEQVTNKW